GNQDHGRSEVDAGHRNLTAIMHMSLLRSEPMRIATPVSGFHTASVGGGQLMYVSSSRFREASQRYRALAGASHPDA
ncbi:hypothetical protein, partial [Dyella flava]|uniref:hypothetical protein n=1 Tax=Dyella flava TaxID=1920170 RepID=UPI0024E12EF1